MTAMNSPSSNPDPTPTPPPIPPTMSAPAFYVATRPSGPRVGAIVWGVIVAVLGLVIMAGAMHRGFVEAEVVAIGALFAAGAALLLGAVAMMVRARTRANTPPPAVPPTQ